MTRVSGRPPDLPQGESDSTGFRWEAMSANEWAWLRFQPWKVDALAKKAQQHRDNLIEMQGVADDEAVYALSIWGARGPAAMRALVDRLPFSKKWIAVIPEADLSRSVIIATASQPDHFDLELGSSDLDMAELARLSALFEAHKRRNSP